MSALNIPTQFSTDHAPAPGSGDVIGGAGLVSGFLTDIDDAGRLALAYFIRNPATDPEEVFKQLRERHDPEGALCWEHGDCQNDVRESIRTAQADAWRILNNKSPVFQWHISEVAGGAKAIAEVISGGDLLSQQPPPHDPILEALFDYGSTVEIIGPSKTRKSFLALQLALGLASGRDLLGLPIRQPVKVLLVNLELTASDMHRRTWRMARTHRISKDDIGDRLTVLNLRDELEAGKALRAIHEAVKTGLYQIVIVDPVYPLLTGPENAPETWAPLMASFNRWATQCGAVIYIHHDGKGAAGERDIRDRGAGSSITGRNAYARITITPQKSDPENSIILDFMLRGYAPHKPVTLTFRDDAFHSSDLPPLPLTSQDRRSKRGEVDLEMVLALVKHKPIPATVFMEKLQKMGVAEKRARAIRDELFESKSLDKFKGFGKSAFYGIPSHIAEMREAKNA